MLRLARWKWSRRKGSYHGFFVELDGLDRWSCSDQRQRLNLYSSRPRVVVDRPSQRIPQVRSSFRHQNIQRLEQCDCWFPCLCKASLQLWRRLEWVSSLNKSEIWHKECDWRHYLSVVLFDVLLSNQLHDLLMYLLAHWMQHPLLQLSSSLRRQQVCFRDPLS